MSNKSPHWEQDISGITFCSECKADSRFEGFGFCDFEFCPYCGVKMNQNQEDFLLKPCPFCGSILSEPDIFRHDYTNAPSTYSVVCYECNASVSHLYETKQEAIDAWNNREG